MAAGVRPPKLPCPVIGVIGGVASGKSLVAQQLGLLGARLLDGDRAAHEVLRRRDVKQAARSRWGDRIFDDSGEIDRSALATIVFANPPELTFLEQLTHPLIGQLLKQQADRLAAGAPALVLDAAVMLKAGWDRMCDVIVFVDAPREVRLERARNRGWNEEQFAAREALQEPVATKRRRADVIIDNAASPEETAAAVRRFWNQTIAP